jgi:N-acetylglucosamine-6-phosphate deacetylase
MRLLLVNASLVLPPKRGVATGSLCIEEGVIKDVHLSEDCVDEYLADDADEVIDCGGDFVVAGLIDIHCHGAMGRDAMEANSEAFEAVLRYHATRGTTTVVLTTVAASTAEMLAVLHCAEEFSGRRMEGGKRFQQARLAGIHLEGPYFSSLRRGAHRSEMLRHPLPEETRLLREYAAVIRRMTLAPELPGALQLVREMTACGVEMSAGHSDATREEALDGFAAGISQVTHLYNCMSSLQSKQGIKSAGLAEAALTTLGVLCEVIADGIHLPATMLRLAWLAKGWRELVLVSDATSGAGLPEGSTFELGGLTCRVEEGASWTGKGPEKRLAGSTAAMLDGVRVMVEQAGVPLAEAVAMATIVPAGALSQDDSIGSLEVGKKADLLRFSSDWKVKGVWLGGEKLETAAR